MVASGRLAVGIGRDEAVRAQSSRTRTGQNRDEGGTSVERAPDAQRPRRNVRVPAWLFTVSV